MSLRTGFCLTMVWLACFLPACESLPFAFDPLGAAESLGDRDHDGWADCPDDALNTTVTCDCDDTHPSRNPGQTELCDGIDNDCDGLVPFQELDQDVDTFTPCGHGDCDDLNPKVYRNALEQCDGLDDNCDGLVPNEERDQDLDGLSPCQGDCDDLNSDVQTAPTWHEDRDGDGFGNPNSPRTACLPPSGYVSNTLDCDDTRSEVNPNALELCDGIDQDCNGDPRNYYDGDHDGFGRSSTGPCENGYGWIGRGGDCDDTHPLIYPGASEDPAGQGTGDGNDNNCNGDIDEGTTGYDGDRDGVTVLEGDCDDENRYRHPQAVEICDGIDNDCDQQQDELTEAGDGCVWFVSSLNTSAAEDGLTWETAFRTWDALTPYLQPGQQVWAARGTYHATEAGHPVLTMQAGVTYRGGFFGNETMLSARPYPFVGTVLDGDTDLSGLADADAVHSPGDANPVVMGAMAARLEGFIIQNGYATLSNGHPDGAGLLMTDAGHLEIVFCTFQSNYAEGSGGGLALGSASSSAVLDSRFLLNRAEEAGGAGILSGQMTQMQRVDFLQNEAGAGGALLVLRTPLVLDRVAFAENRAHTGNGGALLMGPEMSSEAQQLVSILDASFAQNAAPNGSGGGIFAGNVSLSLEHSAFYKNTAESGAAISTQGSTLSLSHSILFGQLSDETSPSLEGAEHTQVLIEDSALPQAELPTGADTRNNILLDPTQNPFDMSTSLLKQGRLMLRPHEEESASPSSEEAESALYVNPCIRSEVDENTSYALWTTQSDFAPDIGAADPGRRYYPEVRYIDGSSLARVSDGLNPESAFRTPAEAMASLPEAPFVLFRLAPGLYEPTAAQAPVFDLPAGVWLRGGEDDSNALEVILSGDFDQDNTWSSNDAKHILKAPANALLANLTFTLGNGDVGGCVYAPQGHLFLFDALFFQCRAGQGGAVFVGGPALISRSTFFDNQAQGNGGAVYATGEEEQQLLLLSPDFVSNRAEQGGAVYSVLDMQWIQPEGCDAEQENCPLVLYNEASEGGTLYAQGTLLTPRIIQLQGGEISSSMAGSGGAISVSFADVQLDALSLDGGQAVLGGGIYASKSMLTLNNVLLEDLLADDGGALWGVDVTLTADRTEWIGNSALSGGAIYLSGHSGIQLTENLLSFNQAEYGGALQLYDTTLDIQDSTLVTNYALEGGAIHLDQGAVSLTNTSLINNIAQQGGAVWNLGGNLSFVNVTMAYNRSDREGAAIYALVASYAGDDTELRLLNSILWANEGANSELFVDDTSRLSLTYSASSELWEGLGNIELSSDPFVLGAAGELFLNQENNPCIDAGDSTELSWDWRSQSTSLDGALDQGVVDLGRHYLP